LRYRLELLLAHLALALLKWTPVAVSFAIARVLTSILDLAIPRLRRTARVNLKLAGYPEQQHDAIIDGVFASIARLIAVFAKFPYLTQRELPKWIGYDGLEHFRQAKKGGKGVLFATAHFGNWELSAFAHGVLTEAMNVVVRPLDNPFIDRFVEHYRTLGGNRIIEKKNAARGIVRALAANEAVGILIDQNTTPQEGVFIDFFGVKACAGSAFVKLAHHTGAAVLPGFAFWSKKEKRYVLRFYPPVHMTGDVTHDTQRLHSVIESIVREFPDQWLWIHRRWKTRPAGEPALY
jgi:KDO2-lipid IV(A) lauroyltransferase